MCECVNFTMMYEFPSEEGEKGPFVLNEVMWLKNKPCLLKSSFCFRHGKGFLSCQVRQ